MVKLLSINEILNKDLYLYVLEHPSIGMHSKYD